MQYFKLYELSLLYFSIFFKLVKVLKSCFIESIEFRCTEKEILKGTLESLMQEKHLLLSIKQERMKKQNLVEKPTVVVGILLVNKCHFSEEGSTLLDSIIFQIMCKKTTKLIRFRGQFLYQILLVKHNSNQALIFWILFNFSFILQLS